MKRTTVIALTGTMLWVVLPGSVEAHGLIALSGNPDLDAVLDLFGPLLLFGLFWGALELRSRMVKAKEKKKRLPRSEE